MGIKDRLRKLEQASEDEFHFVAQPDGTVMKFPRGAAADALIALIDGRDHEFAQAVRRSPDAEWSQSFFAAFPMPQDLEDLSE